MFDKIAFMHGSNTFLLGETFEIRVVLLLKYTANLYLLPTCVLRAYACLPLMLLILKNFFLGIYTFFCLIFTVITTFFVFISIFKF